MTTSTHQRSALNGVDVPMLFDTLGHRQGPAGGGQVPVPGPQRVDQRNSHTACGRPSRATST